MVSKVLNKGLNQEVHEQDREQSINKEGIKEGINGLENQVLPQGLGLGVISIEGIDRSGKTTLNNLLQGYYEEDKDIKFKKFPDKTSAYGRMVYECLESDLDRYKDNYCLYNSMDKNQGIERLLERGNSGLCIIDRFDVTQYVYGKGLGVENPLEYLRYESDVVIYINITPEESLRRGSILGDNDLIEQDKDILTNVSNYYIDYLSELESKGRKVYYIDGTQSKGNIFKEITNIIETEKKNYIL